MNSNLIRISVMGFLVIVLNSKVVDTLQCGNVHGRNFSELNGLWQADFHKNKLDVSYIVEICSGLTQPSKCSGASICRNDSGNFVSFGDFDKPPSVVASNSSISFYLEYNTTKLCRPTGNTKQFYRSSITFECGRTLGSPRVISADDCSVDFLWESSRVCLSHPTDALHEVRCDAFGSDGKKRDLEMLILQSGGHFVKDPSATQTGKDGVYINVCRDIQANSIEGCPAHAAACLIKNNHAFMLGALTTGVNVTTKNRLFLEYEATDGGALPPECSGFTPSVRITFVCPGSGRGGSKPPIVTSSINCQYDIEWWTEAACPVEMLTSDQCGLNVQNHNIDLDLSPLTKPNDHYTINTHDTHNTQYFLNVCAATQVSCGEPNNEHNAVCQVTKSNNHGYVAGSSTNYVVKYYDGQLSLTYRNGDRCSNGFHRTSVILFHCNRTAGVGSPSFNRELHCNYYFDWETKYACIDTPQCLVNDSSGQTYDLSPLTRVAGSATSNWEVLQGNQKNNNVQYYLNVCGELLNDEHVRSCPSGSSVCSVTRNSNKQVTATSSYGAFATSSLTSQANKLNLTYYNGKSCGTENRNRSRTTIIFYCKLGDLESSPVFKYMSSDDCELVLTWHTAAACPLKSVRGTNCMVSDEESGLTFDLKRLSKTGTDVYKVSTPSYDYFLNVCNDVSSSVCKSTHHDHSAACQVELRNAKRTYILGETSTDLLYYNGFVKLLYSNGDPYRDNVHNRSVQISFLCDQKAGAGRPGFIKENNHTYVFNWYTSYVCPFASTQCMVDVNGTQYDLSSLAKSEDDQDANWSVLGEQVPGKGRRKYYLNVCRPVNEVQSSSSRDIGCNTLAGACESVISTSGQETINVANLGRPVAGPKFENKDHLTLTYTGGDNCTENHVIKKYQTIIHFTCEKGALSSTPRFLERTNCSVSFEWRTEAACSIAQTEGVANNSLCEVKGPNSQFIFNLEPLRRKSNSPYRVKGESGDEYELNICGAVDDCRESSDRNSYAGCKKHDSTFTGKVANHSAPTYSDDGRLTIKYEGNERQDGHVLSYDITFICNRSVSKGAPVLNRIDGANTRFDFQTSLACQPQAVDCLVADDYGNQYDLSRLSNPDHPWQVIDIARRRRFYISVCRPLPPIKGCHGGAIGACFVDRDGEIKNGTTLGLVQSNPQAVSSKGQGSAVTISYMGGDRCESDPTRRYSTRILFQCSELEGAAAVLQNDNSDPCEFYFVWQTPAGCPIKKAVSAAGENCTVVDPLYHMTFNLSTMHRKRDYQVITGGEWDFDVNICGKLYGGIKDCKDSGSCQVSHTNPTTSMHDAGKPSSNLTYEDGVVTLTYQHGQKCHKIYERSTKFRFYCHHSDDMKVSFINESADCTYLFDWPTPKVCPPIKIVECLAQDNNGGQYDLSSLSWAHNNHLVATRGETGRIFYLNVCRSMLHKPGVTCPPNSAACFRTDDKKFYSIGQVSGGPTFADGKLTLSYANGDQCLADKSRNYTTTVHFQCDLTAELDSSPLLTSDKDACDVEFLWTTRYACAVSNQTVSNPGTCTTVNPKSKYTFNLTSLAKDDFYEVSTEDGRKFKVNICKPVVDSNCPDGAGVCVTQDHSHYYSAGAVSSQLSYHEGALSLHYEHGAACAEHQGYNHTTVISFVCHRSKDSSLQHPSQPASKPVFVSDDPNTCTHYFSWHTHLACELQSACSVVDTTNIRVPRIIDLSPLISESGHYTVISDVAGKKAAYFINVCRPLEPIHNVSCPPGAAACEITRDGKAESLGYIDASENSLTFDAHIKTVTLQYKSSRTCTSSSKPNATVSTRIVFSCLRGSGLGNALPRLTTVTSDCVYLFEWGTEVLCPPKSAPSPSSTPNCTFHDTVTQTTYDLSLVKQETVTTSAGTYLFQPCSTGFTNIPECKDAAGCFQSASGHEAASLGRADSREISSGALLKAPVQMYFDNGATCPDSTKHKHLHIIFRCDQQPSAEESKKLKLYDSKDKCKYTLSWPTPHVCPMPSESCVVTDSTTGSTFDLSLLSSLTRSWHVRDKEENAYFINICRPIPSGEAVTRKCSDSATVCKIDKSSGNAHSFGILRSQVIQVHPSKNVVIRYSGGDRGLCADKGMSASTEITFQCDHAVLGVPVFEELSQKDCVLKVTWKTRIACANKPEKVKIDKTGKFIDPKSGSVVDLSPLLNRTWITEGELRQETNGPTEYRYAISLRGNLSSLPSSVSQTCGANTAVCQYKQQNNWARKIAETSSSSPTYVMADQSLEVNITSSDKCGKDPQKTSHVLISLRCSQFNGLGKPTFLYESYECGYFFQWYTSVMCTLKDKIVVPSRDSPSATSQTQKAVDKDTHEVKQRHNKTSAIVVAIFVALSVFVLLFFVIRNPENRIAINRIAKKAFCRSGPGEPSYRYLRSIDDNDVESTSLFDDDDVVLKEETSLLGATRKQASFGNEQVNMFPVGGAMESDDENDLFEIPEVKVTGKTKKEKTVSKKQAVDDLLTFIPPSKPDRQSGVGGEKVESYHDDDDVDMLDA